MSFAGIEVDVMPFAVDALALVEVGDLLNPETLAGFVRRYYCDDCQRYIRKADLPPGMDRDTLTELCVRVVSWARDSIRRTQIAHPDIVRIRPVAIFRSDPAIRCMHAEKLCGTAYRSDRVPRVPLAGCRLGPCFCWISTNSRRDLARKGLALEDIDFHDPNEH